MNKTVRSLLLLYRCYGRTVYADDLLELFVDGTPDVNTQRRTLRRYLVDFQAAGIPAVWNGRGAAATVSIPRRGLSGGKTPPPPEPTPPPPRPVPVPGDAEDLAADADAMRETVQILRRRLKSEQEANNVFRNLLLRRTNRA